MNKPLQILLWFNTALLLILSAFALSMQGEHRTLKSHAEAMEYVADLNQRQLTELRHRLCPTAQYGIFDHECIVDQVKRDIR